MRPLSPAARLFILCTVILGSAVMISGLLEFQTTNEARFACYMIATVATSLWKVRLPGVKGTMSMNFLLLLVAISTMTAAEALWMGLASALVQTFWRPLARPKTIQVVFNVASLMVTLRASSLVYQSPLVQLTGSVAFQLPIAAATYFFVNTGLIACVIALSERKRFFEIWRENYLWSFPHYLVGSAVGCAIYVVQSVAGWQFSLLIIPSFYLLYSSYRIYVDRIESEKRHAEEVGRVQLRTIEALALAIEMKDETTHDHLRRVQVYSLEIGRELGLSDIEMEALKAGALLHDVGKVGVPEYIISKPGKLTPKEFEIMKTHTVIGAEILEQVQFPYPVVPIVRGHHERWDGKGYPDGLSGETIPIGARIVAAVDTLDALASKRQYRPALPLEEAVAYVVKESGRAFDPRVTEVLARRFREMEQAVKDSPETPRISIGATIERGAAPAAGFEESNKSSAEANRVDFLQSLERLVDATAGPQRLLDLARANGISVDPADSAAMVAVRVANAIAYDAIVVWTVNGKTLEPVYASGVDAAILSTLRIPAGEGVSGWVVENGRGILNGNPSVEPGYLPAKNGTPLLRSALAAPMINDRGIVGAITLYRTAPDAFLQEQLPSLERVATKYAEMLQESISAK